MGRKLSASHATDVALQDGKESGCKNRVRIRGWETMSVMSLVTEAGTH